MAENFWNVGFTGDADLKITCAGTHALSGFEPLSAYRIDFFNCKNMAENFWNVGFIG